MEADGTSIAYSALQRGTPVVAASGHEFGVVEHVLEIPAEDLFDGIVVATEDGPRFVDRDQIEQITTTRVRCALTDAEAAALTPPDNPPSWHTSPANAGGASLHERFGRMFGRPHWVQDR